MADNFGRQMPFSLEAEQSVLGAVLIDQDRFKEIATMLSTEDFYIEEHRHIFDAMKQLFLMQNRTIDVVTLIDTLVTNGTYNEKSGKQYIKTICDVVPATANLLDYANIVKNKSILRQLIAASEAISDASYSERESVDRILDMAEQRIYDITDKNEQKGFRHIRDLLYETHNYLSELSRNPESMTGVQTSFEALDKVLVGMGKGDLILVGARPGMGKTSFALNIAQNVAYYSKKSVCVFSLEMSGEQLVTRMLSTEALIPSTSLRSGKLTEAEWIKLGEASSKLADCDIYIDDTANSTVTAMKAKLRRMHGVGLVIIDYLQLMHGDTKTDNRVQEVSEISRGLKIMAKELNVPIICCSQLNRGTEGRKEKIPALSDLRESGSIEQDADVVILLYRPDYYDQKQNEQNSAQIIVAKNRHGAVETVNMAWEGQFTKFIEITKRDEPGK